MPRFAPFTHQSAERLASKKTENDDADADPQNDSPAAHRIHPISAHIVSFQDYRLSPTADIFPNAGLTLKALIPGYFAFFPNCSSIRKS